MKSRIFPTVFLFGFISGIIWIIGCGEGPTECTQYASRFCVKYSVCVEQQDCSEAYIDEMVNEIKQMGVSEEHCKNVKEIITPMNCSEFISDLNDMLASLSSTNQTIENLPLLILELFK